MQFVSPLTSPPSYTRDHHASNESLRAKLRVITNQDQLLDISSENIMKAIEEFGIRMVLTLTVQRLYSVRAKNHVYFDHPLESVTYNLDWLCTFNENILKEVIVVLGNQIRDTYESDDEELNTPIQLEENDHSITSDNNGLSSQQLLQHDAAITFQKYIRSYNIAGIKKPEAHVPALRSPPTKERPYWEVLAFRIREFAKVEDGERIPSHSHWVPFPPVYTYRRGNGSYKALTNGNEKYVGFIILKASKTARNKSLSCTISKKVLDFIYERNLNRIVPQIRVSYARMLAQNLGSYNLLQQKEKNNYKFDPAQWVKVANQLDILHAHKVVHRDITLENMFLVENEIYITDLDSMGKIGKFSGKYGSYTYLPPYFTECNDNAPIDDPDYELNAVKKDQVSFFVSMMYSRLKDFPTKDPYKDDLQQTYDFVQELPCHPLLRIELLFFLGNPKIIGLSCPMSDYLTRNSQPSRGLLTHILKSCFLYITNQYLVEDKLEEEKSGGPKEMLAYVHSGYVFTIQQFVPVAATIDRLHFLGIVHRGLELKNMVYHNNVIYLHQVNSAGTVGDINRSASVDELLPPALRQHDDDNATINSPINAYIKDQYTFLMSMMYAFLEGHPPPQNGAYSTGQIWEFLGLLPCSKTKKAELGIFLWAPHKYKLPAPLMSYLVDETKWGTAAIKNSSVTV